MKEFQKKIKTVVKRHTPDKEQIRRAVKGEVSAAVTAPKAERSFSVGSLAAVAVMFILFVGIVVGSVLVEQTRKPAVSNQDPQAQPGSPLTYIDPKILMEVPTVWSDIVNGIQNETILDQTEVENIGEITCENRTTKLFYETTGYQIFAQEQHGIYLFDGTRIFQVDDSCLIGVPVTIRHGNLNGMIIYCRLATESKVETTQDSNDECVDERLYYYDFDDKTFVELVIFDGETFHASSGYFGDYPKNIRERLYLSPGYYLNGDVSIVFTARMGCVDPSCNEIGISYNIRIGKLCYNNHADLWYFVSSSLTDPEPETTVTESSETELPETEAPDPVVYGEMMGLGSLSHYESIEKPTSWSDVVDAVLAKKLTFVFSEKTFGADKSRLSQITAENITAKSFNEETGYEMFSSTENLIFLLTDSALYCLDIQGYYDTGEPIVIKNDFVFGMLIKIRDSAEESTGTMEFYDFKTNTFCKLLDSYPYAERVNVDIGNYQYQIGYHENGLVSVLVLNSYVEANSKYDYSWRAIGRFEYDPKAGAWSQHTMYSLKISELWGDKECKSIALYRHRLDGEQPIKGSDKKLKNRTQIQYVFSVLDTLTITEIPPFAQSLPLTKGWRAVLSPVSGKFLDVYFCENYVLIQEARVGGVSYGRFFYLEAGGYERFVEAITNLPSDDEVPDDTAE